MKGSRIPYSAQELAFIEARKTLPRAELRALFVEAFGRSVSAENIKSLCKRKGWMTGRTGRYARGNVPHPDARPKGPNATSFKPGNVPRSHQPVGTEVTRGDGYVYVKVGEPRSWEMKHRIMWEQHHGKIPAGVNIQFYDSNRSNCDISNLYAVTREQSAWLNRRTEFAALPTETRPSVVMVAKVECALNQIKRGERVHQA